MVSSLRPSYHQVLDRRAGATVDRGAADAADRVIGAAWGRIMCAGHTPWLVIDIVIGIMPVARRDARSRSRRVERRRRAPVSIHRRAWPSAGAARCVRTPDWRCARLDGNAG